MKKCCYFIFIFIFIFIFSAHATLIRTVKMKNGDVYNGEIPEQSFKETFLIRLTNGNEINLKWDDIERIEKPEKVDRKTVRAIVQSFEKEKKVDPKKYLEKWGENNFAVSLGWSFGSKIEFDLTYSPEGRESYSIDGKFNTHSTPILSLEYIYRKYYRKEADNIGFSVSVDYEYERKLKSGVHYSDGETEYRTFGDPKPKLTLVIVNGGLNYSFSNQGYFLGGLNLAIPRFKHYDVNTGLGMGYHVGIGFQPKNFCALEVAYKEIKFNLEHTNTEISFDEISISSFIMRTKFLF